MAEKNQQLKKKIVKNLYCTTSLSISELCIKADKSLPVISKVLNELTDDGFVTEKGFAASSGERRPVIYSLVPDVLFVVSIAMDQFVTSIAVMNMKNEFMMPVEKFQLPLPKNTEALSIIVEKIDLVIQKSGIPRSKIAGVGMPGFVDAEKGINYTFLNNSDKSITEYIGDKTEMPVYTDNDSSVIGFIGAQVWGGQ